MEGEGFIHGYKEPLESKIRYLIQLRNFDIERGKPAEPQTHPEIEKSLQERLSCRDEVYGTCKTVEN
jgi:hypothetical protein